MGSADVGVQGVVRDAQRPRRVAEAPRPPRLPDRGGPLHRPRHAAGPTPPAPPAAPRPAEPTRQGAELLVLDMGSRAAPCDGLDPAAGAGGVRRGSRSP